MSTAILQQPETAEEQTTLVDITLEHENRDPLFTPEFLTKLGEWFFSKMALENKDIKMWTAVQEIILKREKQALDRLKIEHEIETELAANGPKQDDLTFEEKNAAMKKILGIAS